MNDNKNSLVKISNSTAASTFSGSINSEKIKLNQLAQYTCSTFMVELSGIPHQGGEDVTDLTGKVVCRSSKHHRL